MRLLRVRQSMQVTGLSRITIYRLEIAGSFLRRRRLSENSRGHRQKLCSMRYRMRSAVLDRDGAIVMLAQTFVA